MKHRVWDLDQDYDTLVKWWNQWEFGVEGADNEDLDDDEEQR